MTMILLGLFSGIAFGFVIQRIGATNAGKMARAHLMIEGDIPKFMLATVALSPSPASSGRFELPHSGPRTGPHSRRTS